MTSTDRYLAQGPRVAIRPFTEDDRAEFTALARQSAELHRPWLFPPDADDAYDAYLARLREPQREGFLICERDSGRIAGYLTINNIVLGAFRCGAIGYGVFAHAAGRGLMSEGLRLVMRYAFGPLGLHRLEANIQPANKESVSLVERAGFRLEGFSPDFLFVDGAWRDHERWAITSEMLQEEDDDETDEEIDGYPTGYQDGRTPRAHEGGAAE
ncbi:GNAT family N-acetyltransferase [Streptomyces sp. NRRL F-4489]|uniref:GNAT family N-acetyltransferase n=1 Tax=Streptomyces sp. NRRL F-4489 TaxID=1609095 RepID=UPI00099F0CD3|nr:GNAT family N-acetyltransferase [Streptomyces sp. NRRL F-4489]